MCFLLHGLQPSAEHPPDFFQRALGLENFSFVREFQFQAESKLEHARFLQCTDMQNVSSYSGLIRAHCDRDMKKYFSWHILALLEGYHL